MRLQRNDGHILIIVVGNQTSIGEFTSSEMYSIKVNGLGPRAEA